VFIPLSFTPGQLAQVDFGEAVVCIDREQLTAQLFCLRMGYSKQTFVTVNVKLKIHNYGGLNSAKVAEKNVISEKVVLVINKIAG